MRRVVVATSFAASVILTPVSQPFAFFMLPTRAWELGAGGLLALLVASSPRWMQSRNVGILGWVGLALILYAGFAFTELTLFPGWAALVPVAGTVLVILSGSGNPAWSPSRLLSIRPALFIGTISYSLYLVHWPLVVIPQEAVGLNNPLPLWATLTLGAIGIPLAWLSWRFVEEPGRTGQFLAKARPRRSLIAALAASAVIVAGCFGSYLATRNVPLQSPQAAAAEPLTVNPDGTEFVPENLEPSLRSAENDNPEIYANGCHQDFDGNDAEGCLIGTDDAAPLVALFGDSHAAQWYPALAKLAEDGTIRLQVNTKSACASAMIPEAAYPGCEEWRAAVIERLRAVQPDVVLLGNYAYQQTEDTGAEDPATFWRESLSKSVRALPDEVDVVVLADTPSGLAPSAICLSKHLTAADACALPRDIAVHEDFRAAEREVADGYIDVVPMMCDDDQCPVILGDVLVYRDAHHITATFSEKLAPELEQALASRLID